MRTVTEVNDERERFLGSLGLEFNEWMRTEAEVQCPRCGAELVHDDDDLWGCGSCYAEVECPECGEGFTLTWDVEPVNFDVWRG